MASPVEQPDKLVGRTIAGKYLVEAKIGDGAMGVVYRAKQIALEKQVALKVMRFGRQADERYIARFKREALAASRLDHINSVRVLDCGRETDGLLYIVMEFADGRSLARVLREEFPLATPRIVDVASQALAALAIAHDMGVIHRDLKPDNVLILPRVDDDGHASELVKVCDFGIAKIERGEDSRDDGQTATLTIVGQLIGTPEYMSPEQCRGDPLDHRSDLYSVGVMLYQMLTGRIPFDGKNPFDIATKHETVAPRPPREIEPRVDPTIESVCLRALAKRPEDRFQNARAMRAELRTALGRAESARLELATLVRDSIPHPAPGDPSAQRSSNSSKGRIALPSVIEVRPADVYAATLAGEGDEHTIAGSGDRAKVSVVATRDRLLAAPPAVTPTTPDAVTRTNAARSPKQQSSINPLSIALFVALLIAVIVAAWALAKVK